MFQTSEMMIERVGNTKKEIEIQTLEKLLLLLLPAYIRNECIWGILFALKLCAQPFMGAFCVRSFFAACKCFFFYCCSVSVTVAAARSAHLCYFYFSNVHIARHAIWIEFFALFLHSSLFSLYLLYTFSFFHIFLCFFFRTSSIRGKRLLFLLPFYVLCNDCVMHAMVFGFLFLFHFFFSFYFIHFFVLFCLCDSTFLSSSVIIFFITLESEFFFCVCSSPFSARLY